MKLAFCIFKYFPYGGLERDMLQIAKACLHKGHAVDIYTTTWQGDEPQGATVNILPVKAFSNHGKIKKFAEQAKKSLLEGSYDVVMGFNPMPGLDIYFAGDACFRKKAAAKHGAWYQLTPRYRTYAQLEKAVFAPEAKTHILILVDQVLQDYQAFYQTPSERFIKIPPGIEKKIATPAQRNTARKALLTQFNSATDNILLLQVGSHFKTKGVDRSIHALAALTLSLRAKCRLLIIGAGNAMPYKRLAKKMGVGPQVVFLGPRHDVRDFMLGADFLLHPARVELAGMVILEALTCGLPVLVTKNCGYAEHVAKANAGLVIEPENSAQALAALLECSVAANHAVDWSHNAIAYAKHTDLYSMTNKVLAVLERCKEVVSGTG